MSHTPYKSITIKSTSALRVAPAGAQQEKRPVTRPFEPRRYGIHAATWHRNAEVYRITMQALAKHFQRNAASGALKTAKHLAQCLAFFHQHLRCAQRLERGSQTGSAYFAAERKRIYQYKQRL